MTAFEFQNTTTLREYQHIQVGLSKLLERITTIATCEEIFTVLEESITEKVRLLLKS